MEEIQRDGGSATSHDPEQVVVAMIMSIAHPSRRHTEPRTLPFRALVVFFSLLPRTYEAWIARLTCIHMCLCSTYTRFIAPFGGS